MGKNNKRQAPINITMTTQQRGQAAEQLACDYLIKQGLSLVTRNFRSRHGEIDLIMQDNNTLVFIEVRSRQYSDFGHAIETVTETKQLRLIKTALHYLQQHNLVDEANCRFDVFGITGKQNIVWIKNAFEVQY